VLIMNLFIAVIVIRNWRLYKTMHSEGNKSIKS
jgi:hypothetical protein